MIDRRTLIAGTGALAATAAIGATPPAGGSFPKGFIWGAATAGHQVEGNNINSDVWLLENVKPTVFSEPSGDADNSFFLWPQDLDLAKGLNLNAYRFSLEWSRIEPAPGLFSIAMLDHYKAIIEGCRARGLKPMVTFSHFATPRWFAADGGWLNPQAPALFARFCDRAMRHLGGGISHAMTLNEPNIMRILRIVLPPPVFDGQRAMLAAAARATGSAKFTAPNAANPEDINRMTTNLIAGHKAARAAIKTVRPDLPVGVTLSMFDDQAVGKASRRDAVRGELYGAWLEAVAGDDFLGVQNYERMQWDANGRVPVPAQATHNFSGGEVYPASLGGAVRYAYAAAKVPIIVTEHGVATDDDRARIDIIRGGLVSLHAAMADGVPVQGYVHWSLLDNFEWIAGFKGKLGLIAVDRTTFRRTPKPSAAVYADIARRNAL